MTNIIEQQKELIRTEMRKHRAGLEPMPLDQLQKLDTIITQLLQNVGSELIEKGWEYIVEATRKESWSKKEFEAVIRKVTGADDALLEVLDIK